MDFFRRELFLCYIFNVLIYSFYGFGFMEVLLYRLLVKWLLIVLIVFLNGKVKLCGKDIRKSGLVEGLIVVAVLEVFYY